MNPTTLTTAQKNLLNRLVQKPYAQNTRIDGQDVITAAQLERENLAVLFHLSEGSPEKDGFYARLTQAGFLTARSEDHDFVVKIPQGVLEMRFCDLRCSQVVMVPSPKGFSGNRPIRFVLTSEYPDRTDRSCSVYFFCEDGFRVPNALGRGALLTFDLKVAGEPVFVLTLSGDEWIASGAVVSL